MEISKLDHLVLTVQDIEKTTSFYVSVMGMKKEVLANGRVALRYGSQKINLHAFGKEFEPKAHRLMPGAADLCFITQTPLMDAMAHVKRCGVDIIEGPIERTAANGTIRSFYLRDSDHNLIEVANEI